MSRLKKESGFTAIELLITLFVAAGFLIASYQLFNVVIKDGGNARAESRAANVAYDYLRRYGDSATNPCSDATLVNNEPINVAGLSDVTISVTMECLPYTETDSLSKIEATVNFNDPQKTIKYATYVDKSVTASLDSDVTDGLVAWWKLNGNANTSVGTANGTISGATPVAGQNGQANGAYSFNGTSSSNITVDSTFGLSTGNFTISTWVNNPTTTNSGLFVKIGTTGGYGIGIGNTTFDNNSPGTKIIMLYENVRWIVSSTDLGTGWHHIVMTVDASGLPTAYKDGGSIGSFSGTGPSAPSGTLTTFIGGGMSTARNFNGTIDDVRIYDRVLSGSEIQTLHSRGAQ